MQFCLPPDTTSQGNEGSIYGTKEVRRPLSVVLLLHGKCWILHRQIWRHTCTHLHSLRFSCIEYPTWLNLSWCLEGFLPVSPTAKEEHYWVVTRIMLPVRLTPESVMTYLLSIDFYQPRFFFNFYYQYTHDRTENLQTWRFSGDFSRSFFLWFLCGFMAVSLQSIFDIMMSSASVGHAESKNVYWVYVFIFDLVMTVKEALRVFR